MFSKFQIVLRFVGILYFKYVTIKKKLIRYEQDVIQYTKKMIALRERYSDMMIELFKQATVTGEPINRPIWWIDPYDEEAFNIEDGNTIFDYLFKKHNICNPCFSFRISSRQ